MEQEREAEGCTVFGIGTADGTEGILLLLQCIGYGHI